MAGLWYDIEGMRVVVVYVDRYQVVATDGLSEAYTSGLLSKGRASELSDRLQVELAEIVCTVCGSTAVVARRFHGGWAGRCADHPPSIR